PQDVTEKINEILEAHAKYKKLTPALAERILNSYLELLDPNKTYFIESDIDQWIHPSKEVLDEVINEIETGKFTIFKEIQKELVKAIKRRRELDKSIDYNNLPKNVKPDEFKDMTWVKN